MTDGAAIARKAIDESVAVVEALSSGDSLERMARATDVIADALVGGHTLLLCGNGGSAADGTHVAAEFLGRFLRERGAVPALSLSDNVSAVTAIANDYGFENVFSRQVEGLGRRGDVLIAISTSGQSPNVIRAASVAGELGLKTIGLTGASGGPLAQIVDLWLPVASDATPRVQEAQIVLAHVLCDLVERRLT